MISPSNCESTLNPKAYSCSFPSQMIVLPAMRCPYKGWPGWSWDVTIKRYQPDKEKTNIILCCEDVIFVSLAIPAKSNNNNTWYDYVTVLEMTWKVSQSHHKVKKEKKKKKDKLRKYSKRNIFCYICFLKDNHKQNENVPTNLSVFTNKVLFYSEGHAHCIIDGCIPLGAVSEVIQSSKNIISVIRTTRDTASEFNFRTTTPPDKESFIARISLIMFRTAI